MVRSIIEFRGDRLRLNGEVRQKLIEPLRISGDIPFDIPSIRKNRQIDPQTPIDLRVSMPRSSLAFLSTLVPAIRLSRGTATVDVNVTGTFAQPNLSGGIAADLSALRFADPILPPIANTIASDQLHARSRDHRSPQRRSGRRIDSTPAEASA